MKQFKDPGDWEIAADCEKMEKNSLEVDDLNFLWSDYKKEKPKKKISLQHWIIPLTVFGIIFYFVLILVVLL